MNNQSEIKKSREFVLTDFHINLIPLARCISLGGLLLSGLALYLSFGTNTQYSAMKLGVLCGGLVVVVEYFGRHIKRHHAKKVVVSESDITVFSNSTSVCFPWSSLCSIKCSIFGVVLIDSKGTMMVLPYGLSEFSVLINEIFKKLKASKPKEILKTISRRSNFVFYFLLYVYAAVIVLFWAVGGTSEEMFLSWVGSAFILLPVTWFWPRIKRLEMSQSEILFHTQYGIQSRYKLLSLEEVVFEKTHLVGESRFSVQCVLSFKGGSQLKLSSTEWDYSDLLKFFDEYSVCLKEDESGWQSAKYPGGATMAWVNSGTLCYQKDGYELNVALDRFFAGTRVIKRESIEFWSQTPAGAEAVIPRAVQLEIIDEVKWYFRRNKVDCFVDKDG